MNHAELVLQRRITREYVRADEEQVQLERPVETPDGKGGRTRSTVTLPIQRVRILPINTRSNRNTVELPTGEIVNSDSYLMLGAWDMDVALDDRLTWSGRAWQVAYVLPERKWSTVVHLEQLGEDADSTI